MPICMSQGVLFGNPQRLVAPDEICLRLSQYEVSLSSAKRRSLRAASPHDYRMFGPIILLSAVVEPRGEAGLRFRLSPRHHGSLEVTSSEAPAFAERNCIDPRPSISWARNPMQILSGRRPHSPRPIAEGFTDTQFETCRSAQGLRGEARRLKDQEHSRSRNWESSATNRIH